jgi:hypothetical protein
MMMMMMLLLLLLFREHWLAAHLEYRCSIRPVVGWSVTGTPRLAVKLGDE